jgi:signal transduction histidine kinase
MPTVQAARSAPLGAQVEQDELLAILCHELRSPLAAIHNALDLLRSPAGQDASARERMHALIERQTRHLSQLTDGVLDVAHGSDGQLRLHCERVDLRAVVNDSIETLEWELRQRRHRLAITWPDRPVWVWADTARMQQVVLNLLANASKYTNAGGDLAVSVRRRELHAELYVRDSGIGIAGDDLPFIFDLYRRSEHGASGSRSGLGIGLALVRTLVGLHGGNVCASSAGVGQGSEFRVRLPAVN